MPTEKALTFKTYGVDRAKFSSLLDEYYRLLGWDLETGIPKRSALEELGLVDVADELEKKYEVPISA